MKCSSSMTTLPPASAGRGRARRCSRRRRCSRWRSRSAWRRSSSEPHLEVVLLVGTEVGAPGSRPRIRNDIVCSTAPAANVPSGWRAAGSDRSRPTRPGNQRGSSLENARATRGWLHSGPGGSTGQCQRPRARKEPASSKAHGNSCSGLYAAEDMRLLPTGRSSPRPLQPAAGTLHVPVEHEEPIGIRLRDR